MENSQSEGTDKQVAGKDISEDEIDLREYIQVIIKRKRLIITIFLVAVILAAITSLILPKVYQGSACIMITPSKIQTALSPSKISLDPEKTEQGEYVAQRPSISIPTHQSLLLSNAVLERVMERLNSAGRLDEDFVLDDLFKKLEVESTEQTNVLQLLAEDKDPCLARDMANIWAEEYAAYSFEIVRGEVFGSGTFIEDQFGVVKDELEKAEQVVRDFDVNERLSLMEIELKENRSQLDSHYDQVQKLSFALKTKRNELKKVDDDIAAMTKNGSWLGDFNINEFGEKYFSDDTLSNEQQSLRTKALKAKIEFENSRKIRDNFINDSKIMLLRAELEQKRSNVVSDKAYLAQIEQFCSSTTVNLSSNANLDMLKDIQTPIAENLPELTIWEIFSLAKGYNFFESRAQALRSKILQQETELKDMEKSILELSDRLKILDENLGRMQANYDFYHDRLKMLQKQKNSLETEIATLEFELSYSKQMVDTLEGQVKSLKVTINEKRTKLTELERQSTIAKRAYDSLASKIEEARIAKAMELGEVKVVSKAFTPGYPVAPRKILIVAITGAVSLLLAVFIAFGAEFWQKSSKA